MLLVVIGHIVATPVEFKKILYTFHMPLFFFLSGTTFNFEKYKTFKEFLASKFKAVVIPYVLFYILNYAFLVVRVFAKNIHHIGNIPFMYLLKEFLGMFINLRATDYGLGVWFLTCIFVVYILGYMTLKCYKRFNYKKYIIILFMITYSVLGFLYAKFVHRVLPWALDASLVAVVFFLLAYCFKERLLALRYKKMYNFIIPVLILLNIVLSRFNIRPDMYEMSYGNVVVFLINAGIGISYTILISLMLHNRFLSGLGKQSLYLYRNTWIITFSN